MQRLLNDLIGHMRTIEIAGMGGCADFCVGVRFSTIERNEWRLTKS